MLQYMYILYIRGYFKMSVFEIARINIIDNEFLKSVSIIT